MKAGTQARRKENIFLKTCRYFGSTRLAVFLIAILAVILIFSTFYESFESTELAQRFIYTNGWFDLFLTLFALNVFCAVVLRYPFERRHAGFIITHLGLLIICLGSAVNRHAGIEGQMYLTEGDGVDQITLGDRVVSLDLSGAGSYRVPADEFKLKSKIGEPLKLGSSGSYLTFLQFAEEAGKELNVVDSGKAERNPAVVFEMKSEMAGFHEEGTLVYFDASNPHSNTWSLGPATFRLLMALSDAEEKMLLKTPDRKEPREDIPYLVIHLPGREAPIRIPAAADKNNPVDLPGLDASLRIVDYFQNARVVGNELINEPGAAPNPAVRFEVKAKDGRVEQHTAFALFPEFDTLHGSGSGGWSKLRAELDASRLAANAGPKADFTFVQGTDEKLRFVSETAKGGHVSGEVRQGEWQAAGWMDFQFRVKEYFPRAEAQYEMEFLSSPRRLNERRGNDNDTESQPAVQLELFYPDPSTGEKISTGPEWLSFGEDRTLSAGLVTAHVVYRYHTEPVPFSLKLIDFRRTFYPGTRIPSAYESDVLLHDRSAGVAIEKKIYMNHPLDYKGFRIFQSSFVEVPPGAPEISIFQVAKAPGTNIIYLGAIVMVAGMVTMFYIKPFSSPTKGGTAV
ncbi:MAG: cytochrome c biogenesis protein ResB [Candidatus Omnitrophica bacterium]|nr:cytochrome c biogenesis protein ResB [Candidatus Omnitrophota bacterium]